MRSSSLKGRPRCRGSVQDVELRQLVGIQVEVVDALHFGDDLAAASADTGVDVRDAIRTRTQVAELSAFSDPPRVDTTIRISEDMCMEMTVAQVARQHARTDRFVQQALRSGALPGHRVLGRTTSVDDVAVQAWSRALGRGRRWTDRVREAALDLLSTGRTDRLSASERSRLRSRLRGMSATDIAHAAGGMGAWARYRGKSPIGLVRIGPSAANTGELGIVPGQGWLTFVQTDDLDRFEIDQDVNLDADGNLGVVERSRVDDRTARILLDTYLLGDARQSAAAAAELQRRAA